MNPVDQLLAAGVAVAVVCTGLLWWAALPLLRMAEPLRWWLVTRPDPADARGWSCPDCADARGGYGGVITVTSARPEFWAKVVECYGCRHLTDAERADLSRGVIPPRLAIPRPPGPGEPPGGRG